MSVGHILAEVIRAVQDFGERALIDTPNRASVARYLAQSADELIVIDAAAIRNILPLRPFLRLATSVDRQIFFHSISRTILDIHNTKEQCIMSCSFFLLNEAPAVARRASDAVGVIPCARCLTIRPRPPRSVVEEAVPCTLVHMELIVLGGVFERLKPASMPTPII